MQRYRALVEYDGTAYYGFQRQREEQPTVQGELEKALQRITRRSVTVTGAGRTDSGVHALGQVISFTIEWRHGVAALQRALNSYLPADIAIIQIEEVALTFHPRFDARRRAYQYYIYNAPERRPLCRLYNWHVRRPLDVEKMDRAAHCLVGVHDFATFGRPTQGESTVREVFKACCRREEEMILFSIVANAFLYRMVRSIVGSLKTVGTGTWTVEDFVVAFQACERRCSATAAPPQGLYLVSVTYEDELREDL